MTKNSRISLPVTALAFLIAGACAPKALASGFQLREQSASAQGTAFAGVAAGGADISAMFFNPAIMTGFDGLQFVLGASYVAPKAELGNAVGTRTALGGALAPRGLTKIAGPGSYPDAGHDAALPELYAMWSVNKDLKLGFSVNAPFGLITEYDNDFVGRYHALRSDLKTVDIAFSAAYRIHPKLSLGATILSRKVEAELTSAIDLGQIAFLGLANLGNPAYVNFLPSSTSSIYDGKTTIQGSKNVMGYKLGLTYQPCATFRAGLSYQSATLVKMDATIKYNYPTIASPALQGAMNAVVNGAHLVNGSAYTEVNLPDTTSLGLTWDVTPAVNLAFEADRTGWSKFKELAFTFGSGQAKNVTNESWNNTMYYSLGATWKATQALVLRAGLATDQGAVDTQYRTPRIPDGDRTWMSLGAGYTFNRHFGMDVAYTHITVKDGDLNLTTGGPSPTNNSDFFRGALTGTYKSSIDILALHARISF